jgi:DNA-binding transcriptional ArsR family regulator
MVKYSPTVSLAGRQKNLNMIFRALADSTRRSIIERLTQGDARVTDLAEPFDISLPAVSKHLGILEGAGLISREKDGRVRRCHLDAAPLKEAADWIEFYKGFWEGSLDSLENYLQQHKQND